MSDTLVKPVALATKRREASIARAEARGFSKFHLIDLHVRIAELTARAHAEAIAANTAADREQSAAYVVACMAYDGDEFSDLIAHALRDLPAIGDAGHSALTDIAMLVHCFADFTHSYPQAHSYQSWSNLLTDISVELTIGLTDEDDGFKMRERAIARLIEIFPHLWS